MKLTAAQRELLQTAGALSDNRGVLVGPAPSELLDELVALGLAKLDGRVPEQAWLVGRGLWPVWAIEHFPTTPEEAKEWSPMTTHSALAMRVLCAAQTRVEGMWAAYCNAVPGYSHQHEANAVLESGDKLPEGVARQLFPIFDGIPYAR